MEDESFNLHDLALLILCRMAEFQAREHITSMSKNPNILYLHAHDAGRHLSCYGHQAPTPALQRFAERATVYRNFHTVSPTCTPSRTALLTGETPHSCGVLGLAHRGFELRQPEKHLARFLSGHGYQTALCGVQHEFQGDQIGSIYESLVEPAELPPEPGESEETAHIKGRDRKVARSAADFLRARSRGKDDRPLFLSCGFFLPHHPLPSGAGDFDPIHLRAFDPLPDNPATREDMADFHSGLETMDRCVGEVLQALDDAGMREQTIVFFTVDHGPPYPKMKCNLSDHGTAVAFLLDYPDNPQRGQSIDTMVSQLDVFPTLCDLAGLAAPERLQGNSLRPLQDGTVEVLHEAIFGEINFHASFESQRSIRTPTHKLIRRYGSGLKPRLANIDDSRAKRFLVEETDFANQERDRTELYDLRLDPQESNNLADRPDHRHLRESLEARLDAWMVATADPLLTTKFPVPENATAQPIDAQSYPDSGWVSARGTMDL